MMPQNSGKFSFLVLLQIDDPVVDFLAFSVDDTELGSADVAEELLLLFGAEGCDVGLDLLVVGSSDLGGLAAAASRVDRHFGQEEGKGRHQGRIP